jgi:exopolysaccharide production protein ExoQ
MNYTITQKCDRSISVLAVTWLLMIPLLYFAVSGSVRLTAESHNSTFAGSYGTLAVTDKSDPIDKASKLLVYPLCVILVVATFKRISNVVRENWVLISLPILAITSTLWSQFPSQSLMSGLYLAIDVGFAFYLSSRFSSREQMQLFLILGWVTTVSSIVAALLFPQYGIDHRGDGAVGAWMGIFLSKNFCPIMEAFLLTAAFYMPSGDVLSRVARAAYVVLSVLLIIMSQSRTGWVIAACLLLYVTFTGMLRRFARKDSSIIAIIVSLVGVMVGVIVAQYYAAIMLLLGKDPTLTGRTSIWVLTITSIMKHPFLGYGYRAFWHGLEGESANLSLADRWIIPAAHNGVLDLWLGLGAVGVSLVIVTFGQAIRNAFICFRRGYTSSAGWYFCIVLLTLVSNVPEQTLMVPKFLGWIMYVMACAGLNREARSARLGVIV